MISRLDKYLLGEMLWPFLAGTGLIVVMLVGNTLFPLIQQIVTYGIPFLVVAKLVACNIPTLIVLTLPAGTALASAWAINRMARDSEVTVIRMAGVPLRRIFAPIYIVGLLASSVSFLVADRVVPAARHEFTQIQQEMGTYALEASPDVATDKVFNYQGYTFDIGEVHKDPAGDPNKLKLNNVIIFQKANTNGFPLIISAQSALYDHDIWTLHNVVVHDLGADGITRTEVSGSTMELNLKVPLNNLAAASFQSPDEQTMEELGQEMRALNRTGQQSPEISFDYYSKLSLPFVCLAFALCAPPLALRFARAGAYIGIFLSLVMVWVGWNTLLFTKFLGLSGKIPPLIAAWSPDILFAVLGVYFLLTME
jgi:LPS export ABC transporter permease LptG